MPVQANLLRFVVLLITVPRLRVRARKTCIFGETTMKRLLLSLVLFLLCVVAAAQTAVVTRNVNLRPDPSTNNDPVETLTPGAQLALIDSGPTMGYYHVKAPDGQRGFVWGRNVTIHPDASTPTSTSGSAGESPSPLIDKGHPVDWWVIT